ncbi:MAG: hypothetical protein PVH13_11260 [Gammaproteobacteria bacterium]|jgi:hypothetical protein
MAETAKRASTDTVENGPFEMASLKKTKAPAGTEGGNWYKYVINQGANRIVGYRQGSLAAVTEAVEDIVVNLNQRRSGKPGRVHLTRPSRRKK